MILSFKTQISGKPTNFVFRIILGLLRNQEISACYASEKLSTPISHLRVSTEISKIHSLREDKKNRWKVGVKIHFYINARQKNMFRFAPALPVISTQKIEIYRRDDLPGSLHIGEKIVLKYTFPFLPETEFQKTFMIKVDGNWLTYDQIIQLTKNDGFDSAKDFFEWFSEDWKGKIIHWTNFKY